jgi:hypothetical protein
VKYVCAFPLFVLKRISLQINCPKDAAARGTGTAVTGATLIHSIFTHSLLLQVTENNTHGQEEFKKNVEEILSCLEIKS